MGVGDGGAHRFPARLVDRTEGFHDTRAHVLVRDDLDQAHDVLVGEPFTPEPVHVGGTFESFPSGAWLPRRGHVRVRFGKPIDLEELRLAAGRGPRRTGR